MHGLSASVDAVAAGAGLTVGAEGVCAKSGAAVARHEKPIAVKTAREEKRDKFRSIKSP